MAEKLEYHFDWKMWVYLCILQLFDEVSPTCEILEHIYIGRQDYDKLNSFIVLQEVLTNKIRNGR